MKRSSAHVAGELFDLVCEAAAKGGKFTATSIGLMKPDSDYLDIVAAAGPTAASALQVRVSANETARRTRALRHGDPFGQACIINDYLADPALKRSTTERSRDGTNSGAAFPLFAQGRWSAS